MRVSVRRPHATLMQMKGDQLRGFAECMAERDLPKGLVLSIHTTRCKAYNDDTEDRCNCDVYALPWGAVA